MAYNFLIVDDSAIVRKVVRKTLAMTTIPVGELVEAANGAEALKLLDEKWIDLIFLDINMPIMDGMQFMEELRKSAEHSKAKVVVVSTEGSKERRARLEELNISAYLRKPVTPESLTETVDTVLKEAV